jgi:hypothetical protein
MTLEDEHDALMVRMYDLEEKVGKLTDTILEVNIQKLSDEVDKLKDTLELEVKGSIARSHALDNRISGVITGRIEKIRTLMEIMRVEGGINSE